MYLTDSQRSRLAARARSEGVSEAQVIRRILDEALDLVEDNGERVAAVDETAGLLADAPDWPEWLQAIRGPSADDRLRQLGL